MAIIGWLIVSIYFINLCLLLLMLLIENKQPQTIFAWFVILTLLPFWGIVLYILFGSGLSLRIRLYIRKTKRYTQDYYKSMSCKQNRKNNRTTDFIYANDLINFVKSSDNNIFSTGNKVEVFTNGEQKIARLKNDLLKAKKSINLEYYIFDKKGIGDELMQILCEKAKSGVKVKLIYDSIGCLKSSRHFFAQLKKAGGEVAEFFPPFMGIRFVNLKINYRNHRKIAVIDGKIGYTGGINIRDDHIGRSEQVYPWRDTHIRIVGPAVWDLQNIFFNDFRCIKNAKLGKKELVKQGYFDRSVFKGSGDIGCQIVTSGPENNQRFIEDAYIKMINSAKDRVYLQTPYFVPDETFIKSLILAKKSGVDVCVMIPGKPDKRNIYYVTLSYIQQLLEQDIKVFFYNGFLHSKTLLIDDICVAIGSCNTDNRSFALNFEITALLYNKEFVEHNAKIFENDIQNSKQITLSFFNKKIFSSKSIQAIFRLFSSLM